MWPVRNKTIIGLKYHIEVQNFLSLVVRNKTIIGLKLTSRLNILTGITPLEIRL